MDRRGIGWLGWIIALLIVSGAFWGTYFAVLAPNLPAAYTPPIAEDGDFVEVDYRGWFPATGRTFDTSIESVARDNASYPKAASFQYRTGGGYQPLSFILGCTGGSGCPIAGFGNAVLGLSVGETTVVYLPPEQAYGAADPSKIRIRPLLEKVPATETMNASEFQEAFGMSPMDESVVTDQVWGWNVTVHVTGAIVTVRHSPTVGQVVTVARRWQAQVVGFDDKVNEGQGEIEVRHLLVPDDANAWVAQDREGNFIVVAVDPVAETFTVDYNTEVIGKTLAFAITVTSLKKASP